MTGRLRVVDGLKKNPKALAASIERPIFILGFPRTGTTTLHTMIQSNPDCQVLEHWLALRPRPRPARANWNIDPDYIEISEGLRQLYEANPALRAQHDISAAGADECRFLFKHVFMDDGYGYLSNLPSYWEWFDAQSMAPAYRWHLDTLKLLQHPNDTKRRWVLKYPSHMVWIKTLFEVYPDACVIQTHRDPVATIPSFASLICGAATTFSQARSPQDVGRFLVKQWRDRIDRFIDARADLNRESHFFDLQFGEVLGDPVGAVKRAFAHFGMPVSKTAELAMRDWLKMHPLGRHGGHQYTADEFGLSLTELSEGFQRYRDRFGVAAAALQR